MQSRQSRLSNKTRANQQKQEEEMGIHGTESRELPEVRGALKAEIKKMSE